MPLNPKKPLTPAAKKKIADAYRQGQSLQSSGREEEALALYRNIVRAHPTIAEAHFQIARILSGAGRYVDARAACEAALRLRPGEQALWALLADITRDEGKLAPSAVLSRARKAGLSSAALSQIEERFSQHSEKPSLPAPPPQARKLLDEATALISKGDEASALKILKRALAKAPDTPAILLKLAETKMTLGDFEGALADANAAIKLAPGAGAVWVAWSRIRKIDPADPLLKSLEAQFESAAERSEDRRQMAFAMAKAMEDVRADDRLFTYLNEANALTAARFPYGYEADAKIASKVQKTYAKAKATKIEGVPSGNPVPIFVTGLPRSGTTLIEQILSSHHAVSAGGEMSLINRPLSQYVASLAEGKGGPDSSEVTKIGQTYLEELRRRFANAGAVTDKSISTYVNLGFVPQALPKSKIIVVRRDPRDSCLALLKQRFRDGDHRYSYSMQSTAAFYKLFAKQIAYWREHAPDAFIEVWYEDVVADLESQARRLIDYCGLEWDNSCLEFYQNSRQVKTLSSAQVRKPIYSSSVGSWKRYETDLQPLLAALGPINDLI